MYGPQASLFILTLPPLISSITSEKHIREKTEAASCGWGKVLRIKSYCRNCSEALDGNHNVDNPKHMCCHQGSWDEPSTVQ